MTFQAHTVNAAAGSLMAISGLNLSYGAQRVLSSIDMTIRHGEILAVIGPNGAGKSSLFACLSGLATGYQGSIRFNEHELRDLKPAQIVSLGLARTFQSARLFPTLSIIENIEVGYAALQSSRLAPIILGQAKEKLERKELRLRSEALLEQYAGAELYQRRYAEALGLSTGQERVLEIIRALISCPKLLLLDEPMAGLSPVWIEKISNLVSAMRGDGRTICLIEHNMPAVLALAERMIVMHAGSILMQGTPAEIRADERLAKVYFK